ncbi:MAG TPA: class I SAM-dependent methyltransferase [Candidatus Saccharimonadia bacterium]|nr:class I SAM-dependent methyltransferase [Candidatus Saccharimonadia bacterium]
MSEEKAAMIDISYAETVTGWMAPSELEYLASLAEKSLCIAEIGSWQGRSTSALAQHTPGIVVAVDTFQGSVEHHAMLQGKPTSGLWFAFQQNTSRYDNIWPLHANSLAASRIISRGPMRFDLIFIDASHDYDSVLADIQAWLPLLVPGGVMCGHDYMRWGVKNAVRQLVPHHRLVPGTSIWTTEGLTYDF